MHAAAEQIEPPRGTSRRLAWVLALVAALSGLIYFFVSDWASTVLTDGTRVRYQGYVRGEPLPHSEFEKALYAYPGDLFDSSGIIDRLYRIFKGVGSNPPMFCHAPLLLKVQMGESGFDSQWLTNLQDDFGASQQLMTQRPPLFYNAEPMPRRSPWLAFYFLAHPGDASGTLKLRNPYYNPTPAFVGQQVPVSATTRVGTVQLRRGRVEEPRIGLAKLAQRADGI